MVAVVKKCEFGGCNEERQTSYGGTTCDNHVAYAKGIGSPVGICLICGEDQRDHKLGYPEHASVAAHKVRANS